MFSFVTFEFVFFLKRMLKFDFLKQFHTKQNKFICKFFINKVLKWFGG
jgi:hypothetical protein